MSIKLIFASTAALALVAGTPAFAARSNQDEQASAAASDGGSGDSAKVERKTCKTFDNSATRMKRQRICLTRDQWRKFEEAQAN
jgi:hypothetical protein